MNLLKNAINHSTLIIVWLILVFLNIFDVSITYLGVTVLQITQELNPLFSEINNGNYFTIVLYKSVCLFILFPFKIYTRGTTYVYLISLSSIVYFILAVYHIIIMFKYLLGV